MSKRRLRLDTRLWRAFLLQIVLISATAVAGVKLAEFAIREILIVSALEREADYFWARHKITHQTPAPNTNTFIGYVFDRGAREIPDEFVDLDLGIHDLVTPVGERVVHVSEAEGRRLFLVFDAENVQQLATYFGIAPLALVLVVLYSSAWIAYLLARRAVSPVIRLARLVRDVDLETPDLRTFEAAGDGDGTDAEIQALTRALRQLMERVDAFVERERTFTREASHELRSPLTVIRMAADTLLRRDDLEEGARTTVERIRRAALDMEELGEVLLMLARDAEGVTVSEPVSVNDVIEQELARCRMIYDAKRIEMKCVEPVRLTVTGSPRIVAAVFGNLLRNACAYTDEGSVNVRIGRDGVTITDSGIGMTREHLGRVFTPYFRASQARGSGHGIGLSMVKRLCDRFGWTIDIESEPGRGTRVSVVMPDATADLPESRLDASAAHA